MPRTLPPMRSCRALVRSCLTGLCAVLASLAGEAHAQAEYETLRAPALDGLGARIQAGRYEDARREVAAYVARYPGDALMRYNLACLTAMSGDPDGALAHLQEALAAGYRDLQRIRTSPELASLAADPRLDAMLAEAQAAWLADMLAAAVHLEEGVWSETQRLLPDPYGPEPAAAAAGVRLRFDEARLSVAIEPPAGGADEVLAVVTLPRSLEQPETARWFELRAELAASAPVDLTGRHGRHDRAPSAARLWRDDEASAWRLDIPWSSLHPYRPPVELMFGLNLVLRRRGDPEGPAQRWELIRDPHAGSRLLVWRRFIPVDLDPGPDPAPLLAGRLDSYFVIGDSLSVELGLQGGAGGPATITLRASAADVPTRGDAPAIAEASYASDLEPGLAFFTADVRLDRLPALGWFEVSADLTAADGAHYRWRDRGFRLPPDWFLQQHARLSRVPPAEKPIVQYRLMGTLRGQQVYQPHDDPTALATAALAAMALLDRAERTGTVLPAEATWIEAGLPTGADALLACQLVMPQEAARRGGEVVLVVVPDGDQAVAVAAALDRQRQAADPRFYCVTAIGLAPGQPRAAAPLIAAAANWLRDLAAPGALRIAGISTGAEIALHGARAEPELWHALLLLADADFDPDILASPEAIRRDLLQDLGTMPIELSLPAETTPRTQAVAAALDRRLPGLVVAQRPAAAAGPAAAAARLLAWRP